MWTGRATCERMDGSKSLQELCRGSWKIRRTRIAGAEPRHRPGPGNNCLSSATDIADGSRFQRRAGLLGLRGRAHAMPVLARAGINGMGWGVHCSLSPRFSRAVFAKQIASRSSCRCMGFTASRACCETRNRCCFGLWTYSICLYYKSEDISGHYP